MKKSKRFLIGFILLWVLGFLVVWGVTLFKGKGQRPKGVPPGGKVEKVAQPPAEAQEAEAVPVRCYRLSLTDFKDDLPVMGTVKGALEIGLKFEVNGVIESINFREGDVIYKQDLIATLGKKDAYLKVDYAKSKLGSTKIQLLAAEKKLQIFKDLYDIGGIIKAKLEEVELEVQKAGFEIKSAEVELASAETELKKTDLYAPRDGVLGSRDAEEGEFVTPNDKVATLYDTMEVFVELGIVERDINKIALDQDVTVTVDAYPAQVFKGKVDNIFPIIEGKSRTLTLRVRIDNPDALLLPGMFARAMITVAEFYDVIVVPSMSLETLDEGGYSIFVVSENNTVSSRPVEVAYVTTDYTVIASGLYEGEVVVTSTPQELKDGMPVDVIDVQESVLEEEEE
ncbi:MAG: efflux RND transporter periplasmic adaptor subunit [Candidatus Omnitrophica bacterium]|nr:efflux RND transporter periplasmic adaptor subunit [Candidatus Omnitrophota bacterium]